MSLPDAGNKPASSAPVVTTFAGPNGSGKSTLIARLRRDARFPFPDRYINADDMARASTEADTATRERQAFIDARSLRRTYRESGVSFAFETVFSHPSGLLDLIALKRAGYRVIFTFVATNSPNVNVERIWARVLNGGHDVPEDKIRARYERSLSFLVRAAEIADQTYVFDNSELLKIVAVVSEGQLILKASPVPDYLQSSFVLPYAERRHVPLPLTFLDAPLARPDKKQGDTRGLLVSVNRDYALQAVQAGEEKRLLLHDRLLLTQNIAEGQTVHIAYHDGYGTVTHAPSSR